MSITALLSWGHTLRATQQIAVLLFIDSMLNNIFRSRLANIYTGEVKTLIIVSTALSRRLVKGGNVDILTSSEVYAERDAKEWAPMFNLFGYNVSNNCDDGAKISEKERKRCYAENEVMYVEIGHFQRDLLLTKYFEKEIRNKAASCMVNEVDSMQIDNACDTLYISHQIGDLRYLKDVFLYIWQVVSLSADTVVGTSAGKQQISNYIDKLRLDGHIVYPKNLNIYVDRNLNKWIENAYVAKVYMDESNQYSVLRAGKNIGNVIINDLQTEVEQPNTQWCDSYS